jgi:hypothetical protein
MLHLEHAALCYIVHAYIKYDLSVASDFVIKTILYFVKCEVSIIS